MMEPPKQPDAEHDPDSDRSESDLSSSTAITPYTGEPENTERASGNQADEESTTGHQASADVPPRDPPRGCRHKAGRPAPGDPLPSRLILGIIIVASGTLMFLGNLELLDVRHLLRTIWPLALVAVGVSMVRRPKKENSRTWGWVLAILGGWWFLDNLDLVGFSVWQLILPTILLAVGGMLVWRTVQEESTRREQESLHRATTPGAEHTMFVRCFAFMSYFDLHPAVHPFRGGDVSAVMGGVKLDLRDTAMHGDTTTLDIFAFWGGIEILVPPDWIISSRVTPIIGGFVDNRRPSKVVPTKTLIIQGFNLMSGVEVKS